jgi:hypothetical protein
VARRILTTREAAAMNAARKVRRKTISSIVTAARNAWGKVGGGSFS